MQCLESIGFTIEQIEQIWTIIATILRLGCVDYHTPDGEEAKFSSLLVEEHIKSGAELLQLDEELLKKVLSTKQVKYPG